MKRPIFLLCAVATIGLLLAGCSDDERYSTDSPSFASNYHEDGSSTNGISSPVSTRGYGAGTQDFHVQGSSYGYAVSKKPPAKEEPGMFDGWFDWL